MKIRKGDTVQVIAGKDVGSKDEPTRGTVLKVLPNDDKVIVSGVNTASKHVKARRANQKAGIVEVDQPVHVSNVMYVHNDRPVRLGYQLDAKGNKVRVAKVGHGKSEVIS